MDGRCTELSVKAHALKGQQCVHCRLVVGDGFVTITRGESIRRFFEHAEEAEEEEASLLGIITLLFVQIIYWCCFISPLYVTLYLQDDDSMDKDGNDLDGDCSRPQKHAKSPELAREFLLDAATVIFKEQVCTVHWECSTAFLLQEFFSIKLNIKSSSTPARIHMIFIIVFTYISYMLKGGSHSTNFCDQLNKQVEFLGVHSKN